MPEPDRSDFEDFVRGSSTRLYRTAFLLTGNTSGAEDLLQTALERTLRSWRRAGTLDQPEAYARRALVSAATDGWRSRRRRSMGAPAFTVWPSGLDPAEAVVQRDDAMRALARLSPRQRAVMVLKYYDDLSDEQTANALGISVGAVKSHSARALASLRLIFGEQPNQQSIGRKGAGT